MVPRGEVGLIFAELGRSTGIFDVEVYAGMVIVITLKTLLSPFALKWFYMHYFEQNGSVCDQYTANGSLTR